MVAKMKLWLLHLVSEPAVGKLEPMGQVAKLPFARPATKKKLPHLKAFYSLILATFKVSKKNNNQLHIILSKV
jgi:hypothetical protein